VRIVSIVVFLAIALSLTSGMHYYLWARLVRDPHLPHTWARALTLAIVGLGVAMPLTVIAGRALGSTRVRPAMWLAFIWMGIGFLLVAFFGIADLGRVALLVLARLRGPSDPDPERRVFLARSLAAGVGGVVAGLSAAGLRSALGSVRVQELDIRLRGLPQALAGFRLVQISDVHVGPLLRKDWVAHVVEQIRALSPDLVAITGDLVDGRVHAASFSSPATTSTIREWRSGTRTCPRWACARCATSGWRWRRGWISRASRIPPARQTSPQRWKAATRSARWCCSRTSRGSSSRRRSARCR
jgi:hypothetical protein